MGAHDVVDIDIVLSRILSVVVVGVVALVG